MVIGFRPNFSSKGVSIILEWDFNLKFPKTLLTDSFSPIFLDAKALIICLIEPMVLSNWPVSLGCEGYSSSFFSVFGNLVFEFLPAWKHPIHSVTFLLRSAFMVFQIS